MRNVTIAMVLLTGCSGGNDSRETATTAPADTRLFEAMTQSEKPSPKVAATRPVRRPVTRPTTKSAPGPTQSSEAIENLAKVLKNPKAKMKDFRVKSLALVRSRKLLGLTRKEVTARLGQPHDSDWFLHLSKPRFMGDRWCYTVMAGTELVGGRQFHTYARLGLFFRRGKVYSCILWVRKRNKLVERHQEAEGPPIRITWN